jgi:glycosyltransferase involved in cell wall biosynthesis
MAQCVSLFVFAVFGLFVSQVVSDVVSIDLLLTYDRAHSSFRPSIHVDGEFVIVDSERSCFALSKSYNSSGAFVIVGSVRGNFWNVRAGGSGHVVLGSAGDDTYEFVCDTTKRREETFAFLRVDIDEKPHNSSDTIRWVQNSGEGSRQCVCGWGRVAFSAIENVVKSHDQALVVDVIDDGCVSNAISMRHGKVTVCRREQSELSTSSAQVAMRFLCCPFNVVVDLSRLASPFIGGINTTTFASRNASLFVLHWDLLAAFESLHVFLTPGADFFEIQETVTHENVHIHAGEGSDRVVAVCSELIGHRRTVTVFLGSGNDFLDSKRCPTHWFLVAGGEGSDIILLDTESKMCQDEGQYWFGSLVCGGKELLDPMAEPCLVEASTQSSLTEPHRTRWPFWHFVDSHQRLLPIIAIAAFFRSFVDEQRYHCFIAHGWRVVGMTAYKEFPIPLVNDSSDDTYHLNDTFSYVHSISNWFSCFASERSSFGPYNQLVDLSESDFYDAPDQTVGDNHTEKIYDFIYVCNKDTDDCPVNGWNAVCRNFSLALECFSIFVREFGLRGLAVGRTGCGLESKFDGAIETTGFLAYAELQKRMRESRFLFLPNVKDASPRVLTEALSNGTPVLLNRHIVCGTKYLNNETGVGFSGIHDVRDALAELLDKIRRGSYDTAAWWRRHYSRKTVAKRLRDALFQWYPDVVRHTEEVYFYH